MKKLLLVMLSFCLLAACTSNDHYDIIIRNAEIFDGTGKDRFKGDLAIKDDVIAGIGDLGGATADQEIDVQGMAVAPGFINMLSWANEDLIADGRSMSDIKQGVTLEVMGEGRSMGPLSEEMKKEMKENQGDFKYDIPWTTLGEYLSYLEKKGVSTNIASFVGNGTVRQHVIGYENRPATEDEIDQMGQLVEQAMQEGAVGISTSLLYAPSRYASTEEITALAKVASKNQGMYISHIRSEGEELFEAVDELIQISEAAEIPAEIYHLKASGIINWPKMDSVFLMIEAARARGLKITADMYTYPASSTGLHVMLPDWVREGGVQATLDRLNDQSLRKKILDDIEFEHPPQNILLVGFKNHDLRKYSGKYLSEVAEMLGRSPEQTMVDLMVEDNSRIQVVYFSMSEENIKKKIAKPWMSFCSDSGSKATEGLFLNQSTHPRAYGSFIRVLGKFCRDEQLYSLEDGVRRLTSLPASNLRIEKRGVLIAGNYADVVVFDPMKVQDKATFQEPHQYAEGIIHVFVNGVQVLKDGEHTNAMPGRFVKGSGAVR